MGYNLNLSTAAYEGVSLGMTYTSSGLFMHPDGDKIYVINPMSEMYEYALTVDYDITSAVITILDTADLYTAMGDEGVGHRGVMFSSDGLNFVTGDYQGDRLLYFHLTTAWDISTVVYDGAFDTSAKTSDMRNFYLSDDGKQVIISDGDTHQIHHYTAASGWDYTSPAFVSTFNPGPDDIGEATGVAFNDDGTEMYVIDTTTPGIITYTLSTAYGLTTATGAGPSGFFDLDTYTTSEGSLRFCGDTTGMENFYIYDHYNKTIKGFSASPSLPTVHISGTVTELGTPVERTVRAYLVSTGELVASTTSNSTTGAYSMETDTADPHFVVAFDNSAGTQYNAKILSNITPS